MTYRIDASEVRAFAAEVAGAPDRLMAEVPAVVERGAANVKRDARRLIRQQIRGVYLPHYSRAIDYEVRRDGTGVEAEIGPRTDMPQGGMGRGVEFGSARHGPLPHLFPALDAEIPRFVRQLALTEQRVLR